MRDLFFGQEMEEFERKHAVGVNRGKFFAADPPDSDVVRNAVVASKMMESGMKKDLNSLKEQ